MGTRILISAEDADLWGKLEAIQSIDPTISGGIESIVQGRYAKSRAQPISMLISSGYEELHEVDPGFCVHITDAVIAEDWRLTATSLEHTLRLRIAFAGEAGYSARETRVTDESALCSFIIRPPGESLTANFTGGTAYRYCSLSLTKDYLCATLALDGDELPSTLMSSWARRETAMGHFPASRATLNQASRLFNIRLSPGWHHLAVRALALDLLRMLFHDWQNAQPHIHTAIRITPAERAKLSKIRQQIEADPAMSITLASLSAKARMNRNKLHFGFKQSFGVSIHEYQTEKRMQAALTLLQSTDLPISDIAERTGYGEPTNFTAAFKKHFAALPREVRASRERPANAGV
jgi:AraC-like DNA-binding protein